VIVAHGGLPGSGRRRSPARSLEGSAPRTGKDDWNEPHDVLDTAVDDPATAVLRLVS
jgi:hypothetical protein